ncbi:glycosyl transferase [Bradyrhizobium sp. LTSPM299]|jgi:colanic acid biosynthesis glycosyl transferase WcaI|uniref:glycosyltransferase family 4 protein n=1 Tax=Bradyrhizobium sp. LTSPM299 TaxID=1619233 RepID=UPI0005C800A4|nr:glycosyltransferase family 4 protein [Bradyrhizobium sp. LTSPM299]KJC56221.1 glycosyl transferase [Bradyrhizobium sp. LTSPM299]
MRKPHKVVVVSQHYPPDHSTTAAIMAAIAERIAQDADVVVVSGMPGSARAPAPGQPTVVEIRNWLPGKAALIKRALAETLFTGRIFFALLTRLQRGDVALTVTAPFVLPYAVATAARLKRAKSALILHDLFPDVLVMSGLLRPSSLVARAMRGINALMFHALNAVIVIGRDTEKLLLRYGGMTPDKIRFIPNWTTLTPAIRPVSPDNPFRKAIAARFVVGLSGNLGFTHDPDIVFEAARLLRGESEIHFLLSGWGIGFERLKDMQAAASLANVTLVDRVADEELDALLSSADVWLIPYRKDVAGLSVPSRFYNLLAAGRPVILVSEPEAEAALTVKENRLGWVVTPGRSDQLADAVRQASQAQDPAMAERAVAAAQTFSPERALGSYAALVRELLCNRDAEQAA